MLHPNSIYNRLPENEPSGSKHVEDIINYNISLERCIIWYILYKYVTMRGTRTVKCGT